MGFAASRMGMMAAMAASMLASASPIEPAAWTTPAKRPRASPADPILFETRQIRRARERREWKRANRRGPHNGTRFGWPK